MFFTNLHALPRHLAQFTALVGDGEDADEIDFVAPRYLDVDDLIFLVGSSSDAEGYEGLSIIGLINQSSGFVIFQP